MLKGVARTPSTATSAAPACTLPNNGDPAATSLTTSGQSKESPTSPGGTDTVCSEMPKTSPAVVARTAAGCSTTTPSTITSPCAWLMMGSRRWAAAS